MQNLTFLGPICLFLLSLSVILVVSDYPPQSISHHGFRVLIYIVRMLLTLPHCPGWLKISPEKLRHDLYGIFATSTTEYRD